MLPNVDSPMGFMALYHGGRREPRRIQRTVLASRAQPLMPCDAYTLASGTDNASQAVGTEGEAASTVRGIVEGIELNPIAASPDGPVSQDYIPAADAGGIIGIEDSDCHFRVQATTFANTNLGFRANLVNGTPSTVLRQSRQEIDGATLNASNDLEFLCIDIVQSPADNDYGANAKIDVQLRHVLS